MGRTNSRGGTHSRRTVLRSGAILAAVGAGSAAAFSGGGAAQGCDAVVDDGGGGDYATVQAAIDDANAGDTICVRAGTYVENVAVDRAVTVTGANDPAGPDAAVVDGSITVSAGDATVGRLRVAPTTTYQPGGLDPHGVLVTGAVDGVTVEEILVDGLTGDAAAGPGSVTLNGIQAWNDGPGTQTGTVIRNNAVRGMHNAGGSAWPDYGGAAGIKVQGVVEDVEVVGNTVADVHSAGWTYGVVTTDTGNAPGVSPANTRVERNTLEGINDGSVYDVFADRNAAPYPGSAFAIDGDSSAAEATVSLNNFLRTPIGAQNKDAAHTLQAECNYWDHATGPDTGGGGNGSANGNGNAYGNGSATGVTTLGEVDFTPWSTRMIGHGSNVENSCVSGSDASGSAQSGH